MRHVEKDFKNPPEELKTVVRKYKNLFLDGKEDIAVKSNCYKKAKEALGKLYHGKCAYCETSIGPGFYLRIDHYRPKSIYRWLVFQWSNLVSSCEICNTKKGNQFPLPEGIPIVTRGVPESEESLANSKTLLGENPLLLHPELDYPEQHLEFKTDGSIKEKNGSIRGKTTISVCGLDRNILKRARKLQIDGILGNVQFLTYKIIETIGKKPGVYYTDEEFWLSLYYKTFDELQEFQNPENDNAFTLLGFFMYERFEYFIIESLPYNEDIRDIVRKAFKLYKERRRSSF